jgi:Domain of unknown function (DUF1929)
MARRRMWLVAMVVGAVMAVGVSAVSAHGRPPTEAETILQQTLRDIDAKAKGVKPTTSRQMAQRLRAAAGLPPPIAGALAGRWSAPCSLPAGVNPIAGAVMGDAKLWVMSGSGNSTGNFDAGLFEHGVFDPVACAYTRLPLTNDLFCSVLVRENTALRSLGGTLAYDPFKGAPYDVRWLGGQLTALPDMPIGLWYPSGFYNGKITLVSGIDQDGGLNTRVLTWDPSRTGSKWRVSSYDFTTAAYPHALPTAGGRLLFTGVGFGTSPNKVGFLTPATGAFQAVPGLSNARRDQGASFFAGGSQGRRAVVVGGATTSSAYVDLYAAKPSYKAGPSLPLPIRYLNHSPTFDQRELLFGGEDTSGNPVTWAGLYRPLTNAISTVKYSSFAHQYHTIGFTDLKGSVWMLGGNPQRGVVQSVIERFDPWYVGRSDRPVITGIPSSIKRNTPFSVGVRLASGRTVRAVRLYRMGAVTHQFNSAQGDFEAVRSGARWSLTIGANLAVKGLYYAVAVDSSGVPSAAKIVQLG